MATELSQEPYGAGALNPLSANGAVAPPNVESAAFDEAASKSKVAEKVLNSDIGVGVLLTRLKQSISSARDTGQFLKKISQTHEDLATQQKKLGRSQHEMIRRQDSRQGSYVNAIEQVTSLHEQMAESSMRFALSLHQMHEDLDDLTNRTERGRKNCKQVGLSAEKRVSDAETLAEKAKVKYDSLAEDLDRVKTGDRSAGRVFGIKGPKSAAQQEEDLQRKVQAADQDYKEKVQKAQDARQELVNRLRPQSIQAIRELIVECDAAVSLQWAKLAKFNEKLILDHAQTVTGIAGTTETRQSMRDFISKVDSDKDLENYICSHVSKIPIPTEIKYVQHPTLAPSPYQTNRQSLPQSSQPPSSYPQQPNQSVFTNYPSYPTLNQYSAQQPQPQPQYSSPAAYKSQGSTFQSPHTQTSRTPGGGNLPPLNPVFGMSLDELFRRDGTPVPSVVYQCSQAVEMYGLSVDGIYRIPGNQNEIASMKARFDHDPSQVDLRNPDSFGHEVNNAASLLKLFFRELPDPLLTSQHYDAFIDAARIEDDIVRRDSLHAIINDLPDPNYATLRHLIFHLSRVAERAADNRMSSNNLALCFAPTLMGPHKGMNMADSALQCTVIDTIIQNTFQIFDEDP